MKNKIKANDKYFESAGLDINVGELPENACIKRIYYESDVDEVLPHDLNQYSVGIISTIDIDSDGDVVIPKGIDLSRYEKNPVVLFQHNMNFPIGYAEQIHVNDDTVVAKTRFGTTAEAQRIRQLIKDKVLRTHSIGFIPLEWVARGERGFDEVVKELKDKYQHKFDDTNEHMIGRIVTKSLLIEYSVVTVPANEEAIISEIKALKDGIEQPTVEQQEVEEPEVESKDLDTGRVIVDDDTQSVEEQKSEDSAPDVKGLETPERKPIEIKVLKKASKISKVSSKKEKEQEVLKKLYRKMWGC